MGPVVMSKSMGGISILDEKPHGGEASRGPEYYERKSLVYDFLLKAKCSQCGKCYTTEYKIKSQLSIQSWMGYDEPKGVTLQLLCGFCRHVGNFRIKPNPFLIATNQPYYQPGDETKYTDEEMLGYWFRDFMSAED